MRTSLTFWICLALLTTLAVLFCIPIVVSHSEKARVSAAVYDVRHGLKAALDSYRADNGSYPKSLGDLVQNTARVTNWSGPYLDTPQVPVDPWGHVYIYHYPSKHKVSGYDLFSAGPDGKEGTTDDIGNW